MLPFLKKQVKHQSGLIMKTRPSDEAAPEGESSLDLAAKDLLHAVQAQDIKSIAAALKSAFECLELEPHEEGPHLNESEDIE